MLAPDATCHCGLARKGTPLGSLPEKPPMGALLIQKLPSGPQHVCVPLGGKSRGWRVMTTHDEATVLLPLSLVVSGWHLIRLNIAGRDEIGH